MIFLPKSLKARSSPDFNKTLKQELEALDSGQLPLQQGLSATSYALDDKPEVIVFGATDDATSIRVKVGVFFSGIVAGCSCADDPTPVEPQSEYCELDVRIDKATALATITVAVGEP
ncbi:MAG: hypothetical protein WBP72_20095 [Rhodocyclaceae bacterium]